VSGGGDSVALLALTAAWARETGRPVLALTVDHGLQTESAGWARGVEALAARLGVGHRTLTWTGAKPATGLPAAARAARHRLLAEAARTAGASALLLGHTEDDVIEGEVMRREGTPLGALREWSPSPVWPDGRGVFLLRPLLGCSRESLRRWLERCGLPWIEDPANADPRYARARARTYLSFHSSSRARTARFGTSGGCDSALGPGAPPLRGSGRDDGIEVSVDGRVEIPRSASAARLAAAIACASGGSGMLRRERVERLQDRLSQTTDITATLGGARIVAARDKVTIGRDAGESARGGLPDLDLKAGETVVWDGRFELTAHAAGLNAGPLKGRIAALPPAERAALKRVPAWARPALPAVFGPGLVTSPLLAEGPVQARCLVADRFSAAIGAVLREP
jgi:tRNA(Ile)-lysidine synthase